MSSSAFKTLERAFKEVTPLRGNVSAFTVLLLVQYSLTLIDVYHTYTPYKLK